MHCELATGNTCENQLVIKEQQEIVAKSAYKLTKLLPTCNVGALFVRGLGVDVLLPFLLDKSFLFVEDNTFISSNFSINWKKRNIVECDNITT